MVLFFEKGKPTRKIWYYQLNLSRSLGKTNPLNDNDLAEFLRLQKSSADSQNSWEINCRDIDQNTFDLSPRNPHAPQEKALPLPQEILAGIKVLDKEANDILGGLKKIL